MEIRDEILSGELPSSPPKPAELKENDSQQQDNSVVEMEGHMSPHSDRSSPDSNCAICLGRLENKSFTDSCFHQFCFTCLLEWSKVKPECPLCKQSFKSIIHNVRSIDDYDQYHLLPKENRPAAAAANRRFRYRTTLTGIRRHELALQYRYLNLGNRTVQNPTLLVPVRESHRQWQLNATTDFRRYIYDRGLWVQPIEQCGVDQVRDISPEFYRINSACTHRLVPWLNRELLVLLTNNASSVAYLLDLIISLLSRYDIASPEFREHIRPYILTCTDHFIHEFRNFARSPYDMIEYDRHAENFYNRSTVTYISPDSSSSADSDVMILSREETARDLTDINSNVPSSSLQNRNSETVDPQTPMTSRMRTNLISKVKNFLQSTVLPNLDSPTVLNDWESQDSQANLSDSNYAPMPRSPQPGPSGIQSSVPQTIFTDDDDYDDSDTDESSVNNTASYHSIRSRVHVPAKQEKSSSSETNAEDCVVVGYLKPRRERTPEMIDLVSDDERSYKPATHGSRSHSRDSYCEYQTSSHTQASSSRQFNSSSSSTSRCENHQNRQKGSSRSSSRSPSCWKWTAYEGGGGKLQREYSRSGSQETEYRHRSRSRLSTERHSHKHKTKKHKKHKRKHKYTHKKEAKSPETCKKHYKGHKNSDKQ